MEQVQLNEQEQESLKASEGAHIEDALGQVVDTEDAGDVNSDVGDKSAEELAAEQAALQAELDKALGKEPEVTSEEQADKATEGQDSEEVLELRARLAALESEQAEKEIFSMVGGQEQYQAMTQWAETGLPQEEVDLYNSIMADGTASQKTFAARALQAIYKNEVGHEGVMYSGKPSHSEGGAYRSDDELYADMANPLYREDSPAGEAFRSKVAQRMTGMSAGQTMDGWVHA